MTFQDLILKLQTYWAERGCILAQGYDQEVGAGTMNPATFLRVLGPEPWSVAYVEPSRRPADGRFGAYVKKTGDGFQAKYETFLVNVQAGSAMKVTETLAPGEFTERYAAMVEAQIRSAPADWPWSHKRWRLKKPLYGG